MELCDLSFPLSAIGAFVLVLSLFLSLGRYSRSRFLSGGKTAAALMILVCILVAVEGTWKLELMHRLVFLVPMLLLIVVLGWCAFDAIARKRSLSFILTHWGLFLILSGGFFGAPDFSSASMIVTRETESSQAVSRDGFAVPLGFSVKLEEFRIDFYDDGVSPKQYSSTLVVDGEEKVTAVNRPCLHKGWLIYQSDYGEGYSVIRLVRDPWLPVVFLGMLLLALGAVLELKRTWHSPRVLLLVIVLAVVFGVISLAKISFGTLMPALRSLWFVPHLIIYMLAYSILALALVLCFVPRQTSLELASRLLGTASSLLVIGMLCGAVWAKMAWGDYWTWDAKECWAAVTWILTLVGTHLPVRRSRARLGAVILAAFLAMQVTWYGVNYLPSAHYSMHTYNSSEG